MAAATGSRSCKARGLVPTDAGGRLMKKPRVKRSLFAALLAIAAATIAAGRASAATLSVCPSGCAFTQIAPALAAANDGDTISIGAGTYNGGLTVDKSVKLVGAGA